MKNEACIQLRLVGAAALVLALLAPVRAGAYPAAGSDEFQTGATVGISAQPNCASPTSVIAIGPTKVKRGDPYNPGDGKITIDTEIVSLQLTGTSGIVIREAPGGSTTTGAQRIGVEMTITAPCTTPGASGDGGPGCSPGKITQQTAGTDYPADSFFDVFVEIETGGNTFFNKTPIRMQTVISSIPPIGGTYTTPTGCLALFNKANPAGPPVLYLGHAKHAIPPDHFLCYTVATTKGTPKFTPKLNLSLVDQFESKTFDAVKPLHLCNPADKNSGGIQEEDTHLKSYKLKPIKDAPKHVPQTGVRVLNQFGEIFVDTIKPELLLVPSAKEADPSQPPPDPPNLAGLIVDHYKCYKVKVTKGKPKFVPLQVSVADQFTSPPKLFDVKKPLHLCTPVDKNTELRKNPTAHLMCYKVKPAKGQPKHTVVAGVRVNNQFGLETLNTKKEDELCVPSAKNPPPDVTPQATPAPTPTITPRLPQDEPCVCGEEQGCPFQCPDGDIVTGQCVRLSVAGHCFCSANCPGQVPTCPVCDGSPCTVSCPGGASVQGLCAVPGPSGCLCSNLFGGTGRVPTGEPCP